MWRRLELVHVLNILKHLKTPLLFGKSISLHGCLLFAPVHVGVNIADDIFLECAGVCEACPWPGWVPNKLKANDAGASDEECCLKTCKLHNCNATWISFDVLIKVMQKLLVWMNQVASRSTCESKSRGRRR